MRVSEVFGIRRVVIVVKHENRHRQRAEIIDYRVLCLCVAREAVVLNVGVELAAKHVGISKTGTACGGTMNDRRAVNNDRLLVLVGHTLTKRSILLNADVEVLNYRMDREIDREIALTSLAL